MRTASEIRQQFLDFFCKKHGHTFVPSSPVVPQGDPTLLFANAGMNQFKDVFLGTGSRDYKRAANTQKCIRAGGKHNDLDDVGKDTYHHTFFEMLGNWSFGDYFKKEAIAWAWELLTDVWKLDKDRLHVTVFGGDKGEKLDRDDEAADLWHKVAGVPRARIHSGSKKDNFWEMGSTGPCGPCTEIHIDLTPDKSGAGLVNAGSQQVIEIWNLVFIQFNRNEDQSLTPLPAKHVDTGMGFERVTAALQGKASTYDTDVFAPLFAAVHKLTGAAPYGGRFDDLKDTAYRVIADHVRMLTFAITDGGVPSNEKGGYVLRSVLRRAERYGRQYLGTKSPFIHELVPTVVETMGGAFPELKARADKVREIVIDEEKTFLRTLDRGITLFADVAKRSAGGVISGEDVFQLHTTYGFFPDITEQMAAEAGLRTDRDKYQQLWDDHIRISGPKGPRPVISAIQGELPKTDDSPKFGPLHATAPVVGWVRDNAVVRTGTLSVGEEAAVLLAQTNFYAEQGGQVGDAGSVTTPTGRFRVEDTQRLGDAVLHVGRVEEGSVSPGQPAQLAVDDRRLDTMRNHTATHLLNLALRRVLGAHVDQKGSLVDGEKTRFDFSHNQALTPAEVAEVERLVNEQITLNLPVTAQVLPLAQAKQVKGVRAVFGEKYPDPVRVVLIGPANAQTATEDHSVEFCGGTHLARTGGAGFFKVVSQEAVAKGVRRLTAVTGQRAVAAVQQMAGVLDELTGRFNCQPQELPARVAALQDEVKKLQQQLKKGAAGDLAGAVDRLLEAAPEAGGAKLVIGEVPAASTDQLRQQIDRVRQKAGSAVIVFASSDDGKVPVIAALTPDLVKKGLSAGEIVKAAAEVVGGKGGGKPDLAQAGGKDASKIADALAVARKLAEEKLR